MMKTTKKGTITILFLIFFGTSSCSKQEISKEEISEVKSKFSMELIDSLKTFYSESLSVKKSEIIYLDKKNRFETNGLSISTDSLLMYFKSCNQK